MGQMHRTLTSTMNLRLLFLMVLFSIIFSISAQAQNWSTFLDPSRGINWSSAGFTIPNYTTNCSVQPTLTANSSSAASANTTAIQNALASCDGTHNVVNLPAGTYYIVGLNYKGSNQVLRGAGANSTYIYMTGDSSSCNGWSLGICMGEDTGVYWGNGSVQPPSGSNQCLWTAGYSQGTTTITLGNCGGTPTANTLMMLDQANDSSDTNGIYICDSATAGCTGEATANEDGRIIGGVSHSQTQSVWVTRVTSLGGGSYSVTITPGVYFNNVRSGQSPGAWWTPVYHNDGLENLTIDQRSAPDGISIFNCYQCWIKNIRSINANRNHVVLYQNLQSVVRDSYFYGAQTPGTSQSYGIEFETGTSALLLENNIIRQTTAPIMFGQGTGNVIGYNVMLDNQQSGANIQYPYYAHNAGSEMNLWEGNVVDGINSDSSTWGSSVLGTFFRNQLPGWQFGKSQYTYPVSLESWSRAFNVVGNVLGQPGYQNTYESYATSTSAGVNGGDKANTSIYALGWTGYSGWGSCGTGSTGGPPCGPLVRSTLMRWGNWDVVNAATQWNSTEASPAAVPYVNANFTSSYFSSLTHTLPNSLYYSSQPSWWPSSVAWPPIGPDVTAGNIGVCSGGTYAGAQATLTSQCTGGSLSTAWGSHVNAIPAQVCYLNVMNGPADGSGSVLSFDASQCYGSSGTSGGGTPPAPPSGLTTTVN